MPQPPNVLKPGPFPQLKKQRQKAERLLEIPEQGVSEREASLIFKRSGSNVPVHQLWRQLQGSAIIMLMSFPNVTALCQELF